MAAADQRITLSAGFGVALPERSRWRSLRRFLRRHPRIPLFGGLIVAIFFICQIAPLVAPYPPKAVDTSVRLQGPSARHLLGTDQLGRDTFSRVLYGGRASLPLGLMAVAVGAAVGVTLGLLTGYTGGLPDLIVGRYVDAQLAFPPLLLLILLVNAFGASLVLVMVVVGLLAFPLYYRLIRGQVLQVREMDYVNAARALGASPGRLMFRHVLPNSLGAVIIATSFAAGGAILTLANLSFLGLQPKSGSADWGAMFNDALNNFRLQPWLVVGPGAAVFLCVLSFYVLGDDARDVLDPRFQSKKG